MKKWARVLALIAIVAMVCVMAASCKSGRTIVDNKGDDGVIVFEEKGDVIKDGAGDNNDDPSDEPGDNDPSDEPGDDEPGNNEPGDDEPGDNEPGNNEPGNNEPGDDEPGDNEPGDDEPKKEWVKMEKENSGTPVTFLAQNIRHDGSGKAVKGDGTGVGVYNKMHRFKAMVQAQDPDIIFYNEARIGNQTFMSEDPYFKQVYTLLTKDRWNEPGNAMLGGDQSEPLLFKKSKFEMLDSGFIWLNDKQTAPGKSWDSDAEYGDINTWAKLKIKGTDIVLYAASVHTSPSGDEVCPNTMKIYYDRISKSGANEYFFLGGDFNAYYRDYHSKSTRYTDMMTDWSKVCDLRDAAMYFNDDGLCTLGGMASGHNYNYDPNPTGYPTVVNPDDVKKGSQIDYVMAKPMPHMAIDHYGFDYTVYENKEAGVQKGHISDHWGLVCKMRLNTTPDYSQYYRDPYDYAAKGKSVWFNLTIKE